MDNFFELLKQPVSIKIDPDAIESVYRDLSKTHHPDQGGATDAFQLLTTARSNLLDPLSRLKHYSELTSPDAPESRGALSETIAARFQSVTEALQSAEALAGEIQKAQSHLQKALLQPRILSMQAEIGQHQESLEQLENERLGSINDESHHEEIAEIIRDLAFIKRWRGQFQATYASLWA